MLSITFGFWKYQLFRWWHSFFTAGRPNLHSTMSSFCSFSVRIMFSEWSQIQSVAVDSYFLISEISESTPLGISFEANLKQDADLTWPTKYTYSVLHMLRIVQNCLSALRLLWLLLQFWNTMEKDRNLKIIIKVEISVSLDIKNSFTLFWAFSLYFPMCPLRFFPNS